MRKLKNQKSLIYYDGLQVFLAEDQFGTRYVCTLANRSDETDIYLCTMISKQNEEDLLLGKIDLAGVYDDPEVETYFTLKSTDEMATRAKVDSILRSEIQSNWLPEKGVYFDFDAKIGSEIVAESVKRQKALINCRLNPPESMIESKIFADNLGRAASLLQKLVKYAFRYAIKDFDSKSKRSLYLDEHYLLEVYGFSPGSFTLNMQSHKDPDLFGYPEVERAFRIIDDIFDSVEDPQQTVAKLSSLGGLLAIAYRDFVKFISETESSVSYEWARPDRNQLYGKSLTHEQAGPLYEALIERQDLGVEKITFTGYLTKVDEKARTWRIVNEEDGREYSGKSDVKLTGLVIQDKIYRLECEEVIEEQKGSGKEITKYILKKCIIIK